MMGSVSEETILLGVPVVGGDRDAKSAWFIVVRRDKPAID
jgi:hypothetical protein